MNSSSAKLLIKTGTFLFSLMLGGCAMSADVELTWEWPANRTVEQKLLVKVLDIRKESSGFFNFKKTPSFASNLPDAVILKAKLLNQDVGLKDKTVELILPKLELESIK